MKPSQDKAGLTQRLAQNPKTFIFFLKRTRVAILDILANQVEVKQVSTESRISLEVPKEIEIREAEGSPIEPVTLDSDEDGLPREEDEPLKPESEWSEDVHRIANLTKKIGRHLLGQDIVVRLSLSTSNFTANVGRASGGASFYFNYRQLGEQWFQQPNDSVDVLKLLLLEFGNYYSSNYLDSQYHKDLCYFGAMLAVLTAEQPELLQ